MKENKIKFIGTVNFSTNNHFLYYCRIFYCLFSCPIIRRFHDYQRAFLSIWTQRWNILEVKIYKRTHIAAIKWSDLLVLRQKQWSPHKQNSKKDYINKKRLWSLSTLPPEKKLLKYRNEAKQWWKRLFCGFDVCEIAWFFLSLYRRRCGCCWGKTRWRRGEYKNIEIPFPLTHCDWMRNSTSVYKYNIIIIFHFLCFKTQYLMGDIMK